MTDNFNIPSFCGIFVSRLVTSIRNKKCSVFHICLFNERYDFCDFDNGYRNVSIILSCTEQARVYWIIERKPKFHVLILGVFHVISNLALGVGQSFLCSRQGVGHVFFCQPRFQMLRPTTPTPPTSPLYFLTSPLLS